MLGVTKILPVSVQHAAEAVVGHTPDHHIIVAKNQWSRITLKFQDLAPDVWCEFSFQIDWHPLEEARTVHDYASVGFTFLTEDGSEIDFSYVPGLSRAQIDPYNAYVAGPALHDRNADPSGACWVHCNFLLPSPAKHLLVTIRSWRNTQPYQVANPSLRQYVQGVSAGTLAKGAPLVPSQAEGEAAQRVRSGWKILTSEPVWFHYGLVPGRRIMIRGQLMTGEAGQDGVIVRIAYKSASGRKLHPPYPDTLISPDLGAYLNMPTLTQARRFTLDLAPPLQATAVELGFQTRRGHSPIQLVLPLEVSLEDDLLLENLATEGQSDANYFIENLLRRLKLPATDSMELLLDRDALAALPRLHERLRNLQFGERKASSLKHLKLGTFPPWPLPEEPRWTEDPFRSPAWRLEYHSLSWLLGIIRDANPLLLNRALDLALSWSRSNPWGQPSDILNLHPQALAVRAEILLELLAFAANPERRVSIDRLHLLIGEVVRHGFALSEIVGQNVFSHSLHQLHAAGSLFSVARALPKFPMCHFWQEAALARLRDGFDQLIAADGSMSENSIHARLEAISYGFVLCHVLEKAGTAQDLRQQLAPRLKEAVLSLLALTDPKGMLPAFGDAPHGYHHGPWIMRLVSEYGQGWAADERVKKGLFSTQGTRILSLPHAGIIAVRYHDQGRVAGYFCTSVSEQRLAHGHSDCTSFVFSSQGEPWIVDSGGSSQHETGTARHYLTSSRAHNIAIPNGREQTPGLAWLRSAKSIGAADVFELGTNVHGPDYAHKRIFILLKDLSALAVFDQFMAAQRPLSFDGFLHFAPGIIAALANPQLALAFREQRRLRLVPVAISGRLNGMDITQGRSDRLSTFQGYVSRQSGALEPANVLRYTFSGQRHVCGGMILASDQQSLSSIMAAMDAPAVKDLFSTGRS